MKLRTNAGRLLVLPVLVLGLFTVLPAGAQEKPSPPAAADAKKSGAAKAAGAKAADEGDADNARAAAEALRQEGTIVSQTGDLKIKVESNLFTEFPGFDLSSLTDEQRQKALKQANDVYCTCGCRGDTVGRCVVLDPTCQTARKMLQKILDEVTAAPAAGTAAPE